MANAPIKPSGSFIVDTFTITTLMISQKLLALSYTPAIPAKVVVDAGGIFQTYSSDFIVAGSTLNWNSLGLQSILSAGDILVAQYFIL